MAWKDEKTIAAVGQYLRLLTAFVLAVLLIWMFAAQRVDIDTLLRVLLGTLISDRVGQAIVNLKR